MKIENLTFSNSVYADKEQNIILTNINKNDMLYAILFYYKNEDTFKIYRDADVKVEEIDTETLEHFKTILSNKIKGYNAKMGLDVKMDYTVKKKDKDGNITKEKKHIEKTI